jgi:hypothetical protein
MLYEPDIENFCERFKLKLPLSDSVVPVDFTPSLSLSLLETTPLITTEKGFQGWSLMSPRKAMDCDVELSVNCIDSLQLLLTVRSTPL